MIELTYDPIDVARMLEHVTDPTCGAQVLFVGTTRQWTDVPCASSEGKSQSCFKVETSTLTYETHAELALAQLERISAEAKSRWPVRALAIVHRLGNVPPTEASVAVAVSSAHRQESFEAAQWLMDILKSEVAIWKQENYTDSPPEWIHPGL